MRRQLALALCAGICTGCGTPSTEMDPRAWTATCEVRQDGDKVVLVSAVPCFLDSPVVPAAREVCLTAHMPEGFSARGWLGIRWWWYKDRLWEPWLSTSSEIQQGATFAVTQVTGPAEAVGMAPYVATQGGDLAVRRIHIAGRCPK